MLLKFVGSPTFPLLLAFGGELVLRSNWDIYCLEFKRAVESVIDETVAQGTIK